jgi:hypothetical protein
MNIRNILAHIDRISDNAPQQIGYTTNELLQLSGHAGDDSSKFDQHIKESLNLPRWTNTLELFGIHSRRLNEGKDADSMSEVESRLFSEFDRHTDTLSDVDAGREGDIVALLNLTTIDIPSSKVHARLHGFTVPQKIVSVGTGAGGQKTYKFANGETYPKTSDDPMYLAQSWSNTKLFSSQASAEKAALFYITAGSKKTPTLQFTVNVDTDRGVNESVLRELQAELKSRPQVKQSAQDLLQEYYSYIAEYGGVGGYGAASQAAPGATSTAQNPDPAALQQKADQKQIQTAVNQIKPKLNQLGAAQQMNPAKFTGVMDKLDQAPNTNLSNQEQNQLGPLAVAASNIMQNPQTASQFKQLLDKTQQTELQKNKQVQQAQKSMGQTPTAGTAPATAGQPAKPGQPTTPAPTATTPPSAGSPR